MRAVTAEACADRISAALRQSYGHERHAAKRLSARLQTTQHAIKSWFSGRNAPSLAKALELAAECEAVRAAIEQLIEQARAGQATDNPRQREPSWRR